LQGKRRSDVRVGVLVMVVSPFQKFVKVVFV